MNDIKYNYAVYHKNCQDGFSSLIVLIKSKMLMNNAIIYHDVPSANNPPPNIEGKNVIIMDVAYKYDVLKKIIEKANSVVFIDHHITIKNDVEKLKLIYEKKITIIYDEKESGASLTWKFLFKNEKMPLFIRYIKDNDIGAWKLKRTKAFIYALRVKYVIDLKHDNVKMWLKLFDDDKVKKLIKKGKMYEEYAEALLDESSKKYSLETFPSKYIYNKYKNHFTKVGQYKVAVICGSGCPNTSLLGNRIVNTVDCDFAIIWTYNMDQQIYILSFRSKSADVGNIATIFGGGGHKFASACSFSIDKYNIQDLFNPKSHHK